MILDTVGHPIVLAPLAGGPSTPELAAAVSEAGGFGFLAAGYLGADALAERIASTRALTARPFGVNLFVPGPAAPPDVYAPYVERLAAEGLQVGAPRADDDDWDAKLALLEREPVAVVSFTFGLPDRGRDRPRARDRRRGVGDGHEPAGGAGGRARRRARRPGRRGRRAPRLMGRRARA